MSRKVPFDRTDSKYITDLLKGEKGGKVNAIAPTCQTKNLCPNQTPSCTVVVDAALIELIEAQLAGVKVGAHEASRDDNGKVTGRKKKNVPEGQKNPKDGDLIH